MPHGNLVGHSDECSTDATPPPGGSDPLLGAISAYREGLADFHSSAPEDDEGANEYADRTYCPPMLLLERWRDPARSHDAAVAAVRLARDAYESGDGMLVGPMLAAALAFFEQGR